MSPYKESVKTVCWLFTLLVGLALQRIIEGDSPLGSYRWPCFVLGVFLFLRYLLGSANHLWITYCTKDGAASARFGRAVFDFASLGVFGSMAVLISQSPDMMKFVEYNLYLIGLASLWCLFDAVLSVCYSDWHGIGDWFKKGWGFFLLINIGQGLLLFQFVWVWPRLDNPAAASPGWSLAVCLLVILYAVCLILDFRLQINTIKSKLNVDTKQSV